MEIYRMVFLSIFHNIRLFRTKIWTEKKVQFIADKHGEGGRPETTNYNPI